MSCKHPLILIYEKSAKVKKDGTLGTKTHVLYPSDPSFISYEFYLQEQKILESTKEWKEAKKMGKEYGYKLIPCGKCLACRIKQKQEWATRIELESKKYKHNYFITLTYNEENLIIPEYSVNKKTGEIFTNEENWREWKGTLVKKDIIRFMNSIRKWFEREYFHDGVRFYLCGEYGEIGERPHYHIILMNTPKLEQKPIGENKLIKIPYYTNERIEKIWGKGFITIQEVNWDTIAYTAGYTEKKLFGEIKEEIYAIKGQEPIFANMSRNPGIGREYFEENKNKIYENDEIINSKGKSIKPPTYFDRLMDAGEADVMEEIKNNRRQIAEKELNKKMLRTNKTIAEQMETELKEMNNKKKHYIANKQKIIT